MIIGIMAVMSSVSVVGCLSQGDDGLPLVRKDAADIRLLSPVPVDAKDRIDYLAKVLIRRVRTTRVTYEPGMPAEVPLAKAFVRADLENTGGRTLAEVQLLIYLLDGRGQLVHVLPYPVRWELPVGPHSTRPWIGVLVEVPPRWLEAQSPDWQIGAAEVNVTDVAFAPSRVDVLIWRFR